MLAKVKCNLVYIAIHKAINIINIAAQSDVVFEIL